jgi:hypothetical protein
MITRQTAATVALALCALLFAAAPAAASRSQETIFDATNDLLHAPSAGSRDAILDDLDALGVDTVRVVVPWRGVVPRPGAPTRPEGFDPEDPAAYDGRVIEALDHLVRGTSSRGMGLLLSPSAPIPDWASASGRSAVASPKPAEYRRLLTGLGRRYDGTFGSVPCVQPLPPPLDTIDCLEIPILLPALPRVEFWSMWNEPNLEIFLKPQRRAGRPVGGALYRQLFLAGRQGLRVAGHGSDTVLVGETAPSGGRRGTPPLEFIGQVLARGGIGADGWAHHPYDPGGSPLASSSRKLLSIPALNRLSRALRRGQGVPLPVYVTEYGVESVPDRRFGVPLVRQAEYLGLAEFSLWRNPNVRSYGQYLLNDDPARFQYSFQTGLRLSDGRAKPAHAAFALPLVVRRGARGPGLRFWGHVRPAEGPQVVEVSAQGRGLVRRVRTDGAGYFTFTAPSRGARRWRASATLPGGRLLKGPWIRSYRFG